MRSAKQTGKRGRIAPGAWTGEIVGSPHLEVGQQIDPTTNKPIEFSYLLMPIIVAAPDARGTLPGVLMILAPTDRAPESTSVGTLQEGPLGVSIVLSLDTTRAQFSDIVSAVDILRNATLRFALGGQSGKAWPVKSWAFSRSMKYGEGIR